MVGRSQGIFEEALPVKVALCHTKPTDRANFLLKCFEDGIREHGDSVVQVNDYDSHETDIAKAEVAIQVCTKNKHHANVGWGRFRRGVLRACQHQRKRLITIDTAFLRNQSEMEMRVANAHKVTPLTFDCDRPSCYGEYLDEIYYEVGYDGIKRNADYCNANSPRDRWDKLGIELKPWRNNGLYILILGQPQNGASSQHVDLPLWYGKTLKQIRSVTKRLVMYRQHPRVKKRQGRQNREQKLIASRFGNASNFKLSKSWLLEDDSRKARVAVVFSSNAGVRTVVEGIPTFVGDPICMAWDVGNKDFSKIENPEYPEREQWAYDLAYAQWNCAEMKSGEAWAHLRPHAKFSS